MSSSSSLSSLPPEVLRRYLRVPIPLYEHLINKSKAKDEQEEIERTRRRQRTGPGGVLNFVLAALVPPSAP